jgi:DNA-binding MarR family transcriptional regulator
MDPDATRQAADEFDALVDEMDGQVCTLGRLFSSRHGHDQVHGAVGALTMPQFMMLRVIDAEGPMKMVDIATMLGIRPPAVSAIVDAVEASGFVVREPDADDRRVTRVGITSAGSAALLEAEGLRREMMRRYVSVLSLEDLRTLIRIQHTLIDAMVSEKI